MIGRSWRIELLRFKSKPSLKVGINIRSIILEKRGWKEGNGMHRIVGRFWSRVRKGNGDDGAGMKWMCVAGRMEVKLITLSMTRVLAEGVSGDFL